MSSELSLAALRRTSCSRWSSAAVGSVWIAMLYSPPDAAEQSLAAATKLPEYSGLMYQFSVGAPPPPWALVPPQAASCNAARAASRPRRQARRPRMRLTVKSIAAPALAGFRFFVRIAAKPCRGVAATRSLRYLPAGRCPAGYSGLRIRFGPGPGRGGSARRPPMNTTASITL